MSEPVIERMKQLATTWQQEAKAARERSRINPVADTTESLASELLAELDDVEKATRMLTVQQFADANNTNPSTVRRWCVRGELPADKDLKGDWIIPRGARRQLKKAS